MSSDGYTLRTGTPDDFDEINRVLDGAFHEDSDEDTQASERSVWEPERTVLAIEGKAVAGVSGAYTRDLTVPGAVLPASHVTMVGVEATHRRRGLLTRMMSRLLGDAAERGEPVAVLWASEGRIYQRFGYGMAAQRLIFEVEREVQFRDPPVSQPRMLRAALPAQVTGELAKVYERVRADRVGWSSRDSRWWDYVLADHTSRRGGATALRAILHDPGDGPDGYALWRVKNEWVPGGDSARVMVREVVAATPEAYRALWHFLLNMDLTREVRYAFAAVDEPLQYAVNEPRRMRTRLSDSLWLRLVDVPGALAGRRYAAPVDVTIQVDDPIVPANTGTWRLTAGPGGATCVPSDRPADLSCGLGALGAAYLGGTSLATLAATGQVRELAPGTLVAASTAFGWHRAPSPTESF